MVVKAINFCKLQLVWGTPPGWVMWWDKSKGQRRDRGGIFYGSLGVKTCRLCLPTPIYPKLGSFLARNSAGKRPSKWGGFHRVGGK